MNKYFIIFLLPLFFSCSKNDNKTKENESINNYKKGMVVCAHPLAAKVGLDILKKGGNAFDAAVGVKFALAVVYPRAGNIGGGGFAVYRKANGEKGSLDFREKAPLQADRDMYLTKEKEVIPKLSSFGALAVGVPGTVDGMIKLHEKLGRLNFKEIIQPAIDLALKGFKLTKKEAKKINQYQKDFKEANSNKCIFINDKKWKEGDTIKLPLLAKTLKRIQEKGRDGFYKGKTAELLISTIKNGGGIINQEDLDKYQSKWRKAIEGQYKNYNIISMPPPSSGGIALLQLLKGSEDYPLGKWGAKSTLNIHLLTELERRVYADRATHLGDKDFVKVPINQLLDDNYISNRNSTISLDKKTNSDEIKEGKVDIIESTETTHFSIIDSEQNAIAITTTLNGNFGSKVFVEGAEFFLNNEMDDFSIKPGHPNQFGLIGAEANAIEAEKRMLSSMTPTIIEKDGKLFMVIGTPGGSTIITSVFQVFLNVAEHQMNIQEAIDAPRVHHQWQPDKILYEEGSINQDSITLLEEKGHIFEEKKPWGRVDAILIDSSGYFKGGADKRGDDVAIGF